MPDRLGRLSRNAQGYFKYAEVIPNMQRCHRAGRRLFDPVDHESTKARRGVCQIRHRRIAARKPQVIFLVRAARRSEREADCTDIRRLKEIAIGKRRHFLEPVRTRKLRYVTLRQTHLFAAAAIGHVIRDQSRVTVVRT